MNFHTCHIHCFTLKMLPIPNDCLLLAGYDFAGVRDAWKQREERFVYSI